MFRFLLAFAQAFGGGADFVMAGGKLRYAL
jgi:hypothetical protein